MTRDKDENSSDDFAALIGQTRPTKGSDKKRLPVRSATDRGKRSRDSLHAADLERKERQAFRFPHPDEPRCAARSGVNDRQLRDLGRGQPPPGERIDLHGVRVEGGARLLAGRLESARVRGLRVVVVIHGRGKNSDTGEAVLRDQLPTWLTTGPAAANVLAFAPATAAHGGSGATFVLLRRL